jgi:hypothetical protein
VVGRFDEGIIWAMNKSGLKSFACKLEESERQKTRLLFRLEFNKCDLLSFKRLNKILEIGKIASNLPSL